VAYILKLLGLYKNAKTSEAAKQKKAILEYLSGDVELRSKRELIEKFINENLPKIHDADNIQDEFEKFWQEQKVLALSKLCDDEHLDKEQFKSLIEAYIYSGRDPIRDDVYKCLGERPNVIKAREIGDRIIAKMKEYVEVFEKGMVA
jgi:type I restriction enzyme R subunit